MNRLWMIFLLAFTMCSALGQTPKPGGPPNSAEALVRSLYHQVVTRHPIGIPDGEDKVVFMPYLSQKLLHKIDLFRACDADWLRQNPDPNLKPPFGVFESGMFSGGDERSEPRAFQIESTQAAKDGSHRVYVKLTWGTPPVRPWMVWRVAVIVVREKNKFVVDDVIYLKDKDHTVEWSLSKSLSYQCDGPRWVGGDDQR